MADRTATKTERLAEFFSRLAAAPACSSFDDAYALICRTMDAVEDEMTSIPNNPATWMTDGRMYPPQMDSLRKTGQPDVKRFVNRGHNTLIGDNGAITIQLQTGKVDFAKAGADRAGDRTMNQIERIHDDLTRRFPSLAMNLDEPANERGPWFLFVHRGEGLPHVAIEWRPDGASGSQPRAKTSTDLGPMRSTPTRKRQRSGSSS